MNFGGDSNKFNKEYLKYVDGQYHFLQLNPKMTALCS